MPAAARVAVFGAAAFFALGLDVFLHTRAELGAPPVVAVAAAAVFAAFAFRRAPVAAQSGLVRTLAAFAALAAAALLFSGQDDVAWEALRDATLALVFGASWIVLLADPSRRAAASPALAVAVCVSCAMNLYEVFHPLTWSDVYGRSAGTYMNPNLSANAALAFVAALGPRVRRGRTLALLLAVAGTAVVCTLSRLGVVAWLCLSVHLVTFSERFPIGVRVAVASSAAAIVIAAFVFVPGAVRADANVVQRLESLRGSGFADDSSALRLAVAARGLELFAERPILGHGPGPAARIGIGAVELGTHNEFLSVGVGSGVVGLAVYLAFLGFVGLRVGRTPLLYLLLVSLGFHEILLNRQALLALALAESASREES